MLYFKNKGFTLVEMLVVIAVFSILLIAITGVFVSGIRVHRNSLAIEQLADQTNYAMEYMGRGLRMAKRAENSAAPCSIQNRTYLVVGSDKKDISFLRPKDNDTECVKFSLKTTADNRGVIMENVNDGSDVALTSDDIDVKNIQFVVTGDDYGVSQPKVTILIKAESVAGNPKHEITLQTTISQRDLNKSKN